MELEERRREQRLRQRAARLGYLLRKTRIHSGYFLVDPNYNGVVAGDPTTGGLDLDGVEEWLRFEKIAATAGKPGLPK